MLKFVHFTLKFYPDTFYTPFKLKIWSVIKVSFKLLLDLMVSSETSFLSQMYNPYSTTLPSREKLMVSIDC